MRYVIDIDGTICDTIYKVENGVYSYVKSTPKIDVINKINQLYNNGHEIVIFTARGDIIKEEWKERTTSQLNEWKVKYHELKFGKPWADYYVDDKNISISEFLKDD